MPEITQAEKIKIFEKLPKELRDLMESENTGAFLLYLGGKCNLENEKVHLLSKIVGDIILGITPITSLAQEINSKITSDAQAAMNLAQELYTELLYPVMAATKPPQESFGAAPVQTPPPIPAPAPRPIPAVPRSDQYREPTTTGPEIVDLRKTPPPPMPMPVAAAPIPPKPLTFTKPVEPPKPMPLIEAEPHKFTTPPPPVPSQVIPSEKPTADLLRPQYIIRPPGLAPTDLPHDVLDLRKDKGEF